MEVEVNGGLLRVVKFGGEYTPMVKHALPGHGIRRESACKHFAAILDPGADAYHGDQFHVDAIQRKNDYRICK